MAELESPVRVGDLGVWALAEPGPVRENVSAMLPAVGLTLRRVRERRQIRQEAVADRVGVSPSVLSRLERGQRWPHLSTVLAVCTVLGLRFSDILRAAEDEAFPIGSTPWAGSPSALIGCGCQPDDAGAVLVGRGGDA